MTPQREQLGENQVTRIVSCYQEILQRIKQPAEANGGTREFFGMMPDSVVQSRGSRTIHISQGSEREKSAGELYTRACKGVQSARSFIN